MNGCYLVVDYQEGFGKAKTFNWPNRLSVFFLLIFSLSTKEIEARSDSLRLFETLKSDPEAFHTHMTKYVFPTVEGTDLGRLLYYYTLLDTAGCEPYVLATIKPNSHVKLLKKLRVVANGEVYSIAFSFLRQSKMSSIIN